MMHHHRTVSDINGFFLLWRADYITSCCPPGALGAEHMSLRLRSLKKSVEGGQGTAGSRTACRPSLEPCQVMERLGTDGVQKWTVLLPSYIHALLIHTEAPLNELSLYCVLNAVKIEQDLQT